MTMNTGTEQERQGKRRTCVSLALDVGVPIGSYYVFKGVFGMGAVAALGWSSVVPVLRTGWGVLKRRDVNALPLLVLLANLVGLLLGFETGDARLMLVKDSAVSSVVGFVLLGSVLVGRPMMTGTLKPWLLKGDADREAAWVRLRRESRAFRRAELLFSGVWGVAFVAECALRIVGVYSFSVDTMVWLGTVVLIVTMLVAFVVSGALGAGPMARMIGANVREVEGNSSLAGSTHG
ncbi:VC0807 family protein [Streptomyces sp. NPDC048171]|uniref:VC0807 family protein n=1 Tax=unclassified Streptomyces TaxID=2593676 RepID=UPI0013688892|nr:VC0807 family protein [Streptomyces sp. SID5789]